MHELALASGIVETVRERVEIAKIRRIVLEVGALSGVLAESLRFYITTILEDMGRGGVSVETSVVPIGCRCSCGCSYEAARFTVPCPECGGYDRKITGGMECRIESVEVEDA